MLFIKSAPCFPIRGSSKDASTPFLTHMPASLRIDDYAAFDTPFHSRRYFMTAALLPAIVPTRRQIATRAVLIDTQYFTLIYHAHSHSNSAPLFLRFPSAPTSPLYGQYNTSEARALDGLRDDDMPCRSMIYADAMTMMPPYYAFYATSAAGERRRQCPGHFSPPVVAPPLTNAAFAHSRPAGNRRSHRRASDATGHKRRASHFDYIIAADKIILMPLLVLTCHAMRFSLVQETPATLGAYMGKPMMMPARRQKPFILCSRGLERGHTAGH